MAQNDKLLELLISEVRGVRKDMTAMEIRLQDRIASNNDAISSLKTKFMMVAVTMGVAGGKLSSIIPFLQ